MQSVSVFPLRCIPLMRLVFCRLCDQQQTDAVHLDAKPLQSGVPGGGTGDVPHAQAIRRAKWSHVPRLRISVPVDWTFARPT